LGGPEVPAMGFALGIERVILSIPQERIPKEDPLNVYIIALEERFLGKAFKMLATLRAGGISCDMGYQVSSMKSQMRLANKIGVLAVIIFGDEEEKKDRITLKCMGTGLQKEVDINELIPEIEELIERVKS
jgi:histidyl-tRNA synthetase